jgi:hypothetical protein
MTPEELRLECLKLALQSANASGLPVEAGQLMSRARAYADFVLDQKDHGGADSMNGTPVGEMTSQRDLRRPPVARFESSIVKGLPRGAG